MSTETLHCETCDEQVRVEQRDLIGLVMTCGCDDETFSIKTACALPAGWSE